MIYCNTIAAFLLFMIFYASFIGSEECFRKCTCSKNRKTNSVRERVNCTKINEGSAAMQNSELSIIDVMDLSKLSRMTFNLILQQNDISLITKNDLNHATMLQKLDLSRNKIIIIEKEAFSKLSLLKKLDLSKNKISYLHSSMFIGLSRLERLDLGSNLIFHLENNTFRTLKKLKSLAVDNNLLICDCHLAWFPIWSSLNSVRITQKSYCKYPTTLYKTSLRNINSSVMVCDGPLQVPIFDLNPSEQQLVFEGDTISLTCSVSNVPSVYIYWTSKTAHNQFLPSETHLYNGSNENFSSSFDDLEFENEVVTENSILINTLTINNLNGNHNGMWSCHAKSPQGEIVKTSELVVVTINTTFCPEVITYGRKGTYLWPRTIAPNKLKLTCQDHKESVVNQRKMEAHHSCGIDGYWFNLDTSKCSFVSEVTKILQQFAEVNISIPSISEMSVLMRAKGLRNYTAQNYPSFTDIDVHFLTSTITQYIMFIPQYFELNHVLLDIINYIMKIRPEILVSANMEFESCSKLIEVMTKIPDLMPQDQGLSYMSDKLAVKMFLVNSYRIAEMTCTSLYHGTNLNNTERSIYCNSFNLSTSLDNIDNHHVTIQAALQLPMAILKSYDENMEYASSQSHLLQLAVSSNGNLFPFPPNVPGKVTSSVLSVKFANLSIVTQLANPVTVMLRSASATTDAPAWWNSSAFGGVGGWSNDGCKVERRMQEHVIFSCSHLSHYTLVMNVSVSGDLLEIDENIMAMLSPTIYIGSFICIISLMITIFIFLAFHSEIKMPVKAKHSLVNCWLCTLTLCLLFNIGIRLTFHVQLCQTVGLLINYLTLVIMLWILITLSNIYTKLHKPDVSVDSDSEDGFRQPVPKKPMIRFYWIAWGVPLIICGISAAVNLPMYASDKLCMLPLFESVAALYLPMAVFTVITLAVFLRVCCLVSTNNNGDMLVKLQTDSNQTASDDNSNEIEECNESVVQRDGFDDDDDESENIDEEHSYTLQIRAQLCFLMLYLMAWGAAVVYITNPPLGVFDPYQEVVFSGLYCLFSSVLGLFVFTCYCYFRGDTRRCMCRMLQIETSDPLSSQQQSDITITTTIAQTETSNDNSIKVADKSVSPPPLEKVEINLLAPTNKSSEKVDSQIFLPSGRVSPRMLFSNSHAGLLNRDSSNSISSVALTDRVRCTYQTLKSVNGFRSQSPQTTIGFVHPMSSAITSDVIYYNAQQQNIARKFFQKQREKRQRLNLKNISKSESSRVEDTLLDTSLNTSLSIPKPQQSDDQVPSPKTNCEHDSNVDDTRTVPVHQNGTPPIIANGVDPPAKTKSISNGHTTNFPPSPVPDGPARFLEDPTAYLDDKRSCISPSSVISLSRRSCQSENLGKKRHKRRHRDPRTRESSLSVVSNGSNSFPLRTHREKRKKSSKLSRSISAYEQINNNNHDSSSSENEGKRLHRKPRNRQKHKNSLKKETSV